MAMSDPVTITITPLSTSASDLPMGMVFDVCTVLDAYGLHVNADELNGRGIVQVLMALGRVIDAVPVEHGGRSTEPMHGPRRTFTRPDTPRWHDSGSGPGWAPDDDRD
jgi:hypothetical protein